MPPGSGDPGPEVTSEVADGWCLEAPLSSLSLPLRAPPNIAGWPGARRRVRSRSPSSPTQRRRPGRPSAPAWPPGPSSSRDRRTRQASPGRRDRHRTGARPRRGEPGILPDPDLPSPRSSTIARSPPGSPPPAHPRPLRAGLPAAHRRPEPCPSFVLRGHLPGPGRFRSRPHRTTGQNGRGARRCHTRCLLFGT